MAAGVRKDLRYHPDSSVQPVIPNDRDVEATVTGFAVFALISLLGIIVAVGSVIVVSLGIRSDDRSVVVNTSRAGLRGVVPGRAARIARQMTGVHWV
jgi:hypothetical protein